MGVIFFNVCIETRIKMNCQSKEKYFWLDFWIKTNQSAGNTFQTEYRKTSDIRRTLEDSDIVDHSDVVGASPVGAAPTTSSFSTRHLASRDSAKKAAIQHENLLRVVILCVLY